MSVRLNPTVWIPRGGVGLCLLLCLSVGNSRAHGQDTTSVTVQGTVVDARSGDPLPSVVIQIPDLDIRMVSDSAGAFTLSGIRPGIYEISLKRRGYRDSAGEFTVDRPGSFILRLVPDNDWGAWELGAIRGRVVDGAAGLPVPSASLRLGAAGLTSMTSDEGLFEFQDLLPGAYVLRTSSLGYATREDTLAVARGQSVVVTVPLASDPIELEGITVTVRSRFLEAGGFYRRQGKGYAGRQWTSEQIAEVDPIYISDLITSVSMVRRWRNRANKVEYLGRRGCKMLLFVDDFRMDDFDLDFIDPNNIEALEVYSGNRAELPGGYGTCGVIWVWLKH